MGGSFSSEKLVGKVVVDWFEIAGDPCRNLSASVNEDVSTMTPPSLDK